MAKKSENEFDPYREALVVEVNTVWPEGYEDLDARSKAKIEAALHEDPKSAARLEYVRLHTGFCRQITVTPEEIQQYA